MRYDYSQESANELLEAADIEIDRLTSDRNMLVEAIEKYLDDESEPTTVLYLVLAKVGAGKTGDV